MGLWLYGPQLTVEHRDEPLAQFQVVYAPRKRFFKAVVLLRTYAMPFRSPHPPLFPLDDVQWLKALCVSAYAPRRPRADASTSQLPLFSGDLLRPLLA